MRRRTCSGRVTTSKPATSALPLVGGSRPHSMRMVVVLPEPLGPSMPNTSPREMSRSSPCTATSAPKTLRSARVWTTGGTVTRQRAARGSCTVIGNPARRRLAPSVNSTFTPNSRSARSCSVSATRGVNSALLAMAATRPR